MVGPLVGAAVLAGGVDRAGVGIGVAGLVVADVACAVFHDGLLDGILIGGRNPDRVLDVGHVGAVGVLAVQAGGRNRAGLAVGQVGGGLVRDAGPALQGIGGHFAVAALIQAAVARRGLIAGQHALGVIGVGVVEEAVLRLGQVQLGGSSGTGADADAVLDHVGLDAAHGCVSPAGAVGVLVLDGGDPALIAAVPLAGQVAGGLGHIHAVDGHRLAAQIGVGDGGGTVVILIDQTVVLRLIHWDFILNLSLLRKRRCWEDAQGKNEYEQGCQDSPEVLFHHFCSFF